jgi:hypothetical protein
MEGINELISLELAEMLVGQKVNDDQGLNDIG